MATVLIVDDARSLGDNLCRFLRVSGYRAFSAVSGAEAVQRAAEVYPDVVLMDLQLPDADGVELMVRLKRDLPELSVIIITAHGSIPSAVEATRQGAVNYLTKPFEPEEMLLAVESALREQRLSEEVRRLRAGQSKHVSAGPARPDYLSASMRRLMETAEMAARQDGIVLLLGESGTGKDHLARHIHEASRRTGGPFFSINCAALSRDLAESELFGHEPGAFTGTRGRKRGLLELAENGSLLLNEVAEMDLHLQSKLLTFLDTRSFVRVGGEKSTTVNARIFAATNRDLVQEVEAGRFRRDLYYRLNVLPILLPPLRERREDIPILAQELLTRIVADAAPGKEAELTNEAMDALQAHTWPGNIRELRNVLERALMFCVGGVIRRGDLGIDTTAGQEWSMSVHFPLGRTLHEVTADVARALVSEALRRGKTRQEAADLLGISRHALAHQLKSLGIAS